MSQGTPHIEVKKTLGCLSLIVNQVIHVASYRVLVLLLVGEFGQYNLRMIELFVIKANVHGDVVCCCLAPMFSWIFSFIS